MSHASPLIQEDILAYLEQHEDKDLLRFITCGSVDDGKSTLIGRLLHDSQLIYEDQLAAVRSDSGRWGTTGEEPDLALLVDGLQSEREQGITIDVAYRYFSTDKRKFIIADTPGHEQFTRNMATGASTAQLAVLLVDARKGVLTQTKRHTTIVSLLGIRTLVVAVNKMDLVSYDRRVFDQVERDYRAFLDKLGNGFDVHFVPISALAGDNVVHASERMAWYQGPALMALLESVDVTSRRDLAQFRFPVQYVTRPHHDFRGYAGTIASGTVRVGDEVMVLPSRKRSRVKSIVTYDGANGGAHPHEAAAPEAVTLTLEDELDVSRGDMLAHPNDTPSVTDVVDANVVWMHEEPLRIGRLYDVKVGTKTTQATVRGIDHRLDVNTLERGPAETLALNEIGRCRVAFTTPVAVDPYPTLPSTGSFILLDRVTNATVAAGMVERSARERGVSKATNVVWHDTKVSKAVRAELKGQKPCVLWFTGLSGAGKSTIANALEQRLAAMGHHTYLLDGDNVRHGLNKDLGFNDDDRVENIRRIGEVAKLFVDAGLIVVTAFISPFRSDRQMVRELFDESEFLEVFIDTPLEVAEQRDTKGLYAKARTGLIKNFTGIDSPYERPATAEIVLDTVNTSVEDAVDEVLRALADRGALRSID
jgi:bifunctional enzyme CysN/CysC